MALFNLTGLGLGELFVLYMQLTHGVLCDGGAIVVRLKLPTNYLFDVSDHESGYPRTPIVVNEPRPRVYSLSNTRGA